MFWQTNTLINITTVLETPTVYPFWGGGETVHCRVFTSFPDRSQTAISMESSGRALAIDMAVGRPIL